MTKHGDHLVNHILNPELRSNNILHVIGVVSNSVRYHSRYRLFREWRKAMEATPNVQLHIVECAFGDRQYECTTGLPNELQLRTQQDIWLKECMINLAFKHLLPINWAYAAWIDADVFFRDPNWAQETLHQLQHYDVLQPWQDCLDLGPDGNVSRHFRSFGYQHQRRIPKQMHPSQPYEYAHTGFAWACTRKFFENLPGHGLMDWCILGSADHHSGFAMIGEVKNTIHAGMQPSFFTKCYEWQDRAVSVTKKEVGFVRGRIEHNFHGPKKRRYYRERWQILIDYKFDPIKDLAYDETGVIQLVGKPGLLHAIHKYNLSRSEDSIEEN